MQGVQVKLCYPLTMRAIPESLRDASCGGAIQIDYLFCVLVQVSITNLTLACIKSGNRICPLKYHSNKLTSDNCNISILSAKEIAIITRRD